MNKKEFVEKFLHDYVSKNISNIKDNILKLREKDDFNLNNEILNKLKELNIEPVDLGFMDNALNKRIDENDLENITELLDKTPSEILSQAQSKLFIKIVSENILSDTSLFLSEFNHIRNAELKEAIGWVAGFVNTSNFDKSNILFYDESGLNKRQTLKNLLREINKNSLTESMPFKIKMTLEEKLFSKVLRMCTEDRGNGYLLKNKYMYTEKEIIDKLIENKTIKPDFLIDVNNKNMLTRIINDVQKAPISVLSKRMNTILQSKFYPAGAGEVDVLLFDKGKILGMSITTDHTTYIEQNQFLRHYLKTLLMARLVEKNKSKDEIDPIEARRILNNYKIKINKRDSFIEKKISECNFFELLKYYRDLKGYENTSNFEITQKEMEDIVNDGKKYSNFIFFGEIDKGMPKILREEIASYLMFSYVGNLTAIGNTNIDIMATLLFMKESVNAKFNDVDNDKNYFKEGFANVVDFFCARPDEKKYEVLKEKVSINEKYSERFIHKTDRLNLTNALNVFITIINEVHKKDPLLFKNNLRKLMVEDFNIHPAKFYRFYEQLENGTLETFTKNKVKRIRKSESEHSDSVDKLFINIERLLGNINKENILRNKEIVNVENKEYIQEKQDPQEKFIKEIIYFSIKQNYKELSDNKIKETIDRLYQFNINEIKTGSVTPQDLITKISDSLSRAKYTTRNSNK